MYQLIAVTYCTKESIFVGESLVMLNLQHSLPTLNFQMRFENAEWQIQV